MNRKILTTLRTVIFLLLATLAVSAVGAQIIGTAPKISGVVIEPEKAAPVVGITGGGAGIAAAASGATAVGTVAAGGGAAAAGGATAGAAAAGGVMVFWDAPLHLADDFRKEKSCQGLKLFRLRSNVVEVAGVSHTPGDYAITIVPLLYQGLFGPVVLYTWVVTNSDGDVLAEKEKVRRGKAAVRDACKVVKRFLGKQVITTE